MFEVGFTEIILILGIALLVLGPEKLPKLANQVGRWAGRARAMARQLRAQLDEEVPVMSREDMDVGLKRAAVTPATVTPAAGTPPPEAVKHAAPERPNPSATDPPQPVVDPHAPPETAEPVATGDAQRPS